MLVIFTLIGGLIVLCLPRYLERFKLLRYGTDSGLIILGLLVLFGIHIVAIN